MTLVTSNTLTELQPAIEIPSYDASAATASIVHFGVGGFHRAHQAMYIDRLLSAGNTDWAICGVGVLPSDIAMRDVLAAQENLYTLVTVSPNGQSDARVIGSIVEYLYAPDNPQAVVDKLTDPATRIVSLTITEGGYGINDATGEFDPQDAATLADLAGEASPQSVLGHIIAGLRGRRDAGLPSFTVMSCDNIQGNGHVARAAVLAFARRKDPVLAEWIAANTAFPNSMVDRITPATTEETRRSIAAEFGVDDLWPVRSESFAQWVLEDSFSFGRPPLEEVGVQIVEDVEPYELMKLRLLNASHQAMSHLGILQGATHVHEVCRDPLFIDFLLGYMHEEAIPTLRAVPGIDLAAYCEGLIARFASEAILDTLARQTVDSSDRIPKFLLPVVREQLAAGGPIDRSALVLAAWSRSLEGQTEAGIEIVSTDKRLEDLRAAASAENSSPGAFLDYGPVFGELGSDRRLKQAFIDARGRLIENGARVAIAAANMSQQP